MLRQTYPVDERFWLLSTAYNVGVECFECVRFFCWDELVDVDTLVGHRRLTRRRGGLRRLLCCVGTYLEVWSVLRRYVGFLVYQYLDLG